MSADVQLHCPIHGDVEGLSLTEGPLSECWPWVLVCEKCDGDGSAVVVGYEWHDDEQGDDFVSARWEDAPYG